MHPEPADTKAHNFHPTVLREYDIRGIVGETLSEGDALALGKAFGTHIKRQGGHKVCVGYDGRHSSPAMADALIDGLVSTGMQVENVGLGPTPMLYFAVKDRMADAGVMVTGSHNPSHYNGFKMTQQSGPVFGEIIQQIGALAAAGDFETGDGEQMDVDVKDTYVDRLLKDFEGRSDMTVAWDAGNGAAGEILQRLTEKLPGNHILLYEDIDGDFPNHHPDPTVDKNLADLREAVAQNNCDLGIAFDGDGDRIGVVDEKGTILRCDILMTIYARDVLEENPGAAIIGDVKCSKVMFEEIARLGGNPVMWKTGHSLIKAKMAELKAPLAGELSGHIFFADKYYGFDDALYCAIRLLNATAEDNLSTLTKDLPTLHSTPETRIEVDEAEKFGIVPKVVENLKKIDNDQMQIDDIDGIRVTQPEGWWILRPSNTQNALVARIEGESEEALAMLKTMLQDELKKVGYDIVFE